MFRPEQTTSAFPPPQLAGVTAPGGSSEIVRLAVTPPAGITIVPKFIEPVAVSVSGLMIRALACGSEPGVTPSGAARAGVVASTAAATAAIFTNLVMTNFPHRG